MRVSNLRAFSHACRRGLTVSVSKLTAESEHKSRCLRAGLALALSVSLPIAAIAAALSGVISAAVNAYDAKWALVILIASVPLSAVGSVLRGYFQGCAAVKPSAIGQLIEQSAKLTVGLILSFSLAKISVAAAVLGSASGVLFSEIVATLYYALSYKRQKRKYVAVTADDISAAKVDASFSGIDALTETSAELTPDKVTEAFSSVRRKKLVSPVRRLFAIALPVTLGLIVLPLCQVADSFIAVNLLKLYAAEAEKATSLYGLVTGPVNTLVNVPAVFTVGLSGVLLPKVSRLKARGSGVEDTAKKALVFSLLSGVFFLTGMLAFGKFALKILYGSSLAVSLDSATFLFGISSVSVIFIPAMQSSAAVLQGMDKAHIPALDMGVAAAVKEGLNFILIPRIGVLGFVIGYVAFYFIACVLDLVALAVELKKERRRARRSILGKLH